MEKDRIIENLRRRLAKAEDDIEYHISRKNELKDKIDNLEDTVEDVEENCRILASKNRDLTEKLESLQRELKASQQSHHQWDNDRRLVHNTLERTKEEKLEAEQQVLLITNEKDDLQRNLKETKKNHMQKVQCLNDNINVLKNEIHIFLTCEICEEELQSKKELQNHMKAYHKQNIREAKRFKCNVCMKPFKTKDDMQRHRISQHKGLHDKEHLLRKEVDLQQLLNQQRMNISNKIIKLNSKEIFQKNECKCKGVCHINHAKNRWVKRQSNDLFNKLSFLNEKFSVSTTSKLKCESCEYNTLNDVITQKQ